MNGIFRIPIRGERDNIYRWFGRFGRMSTRRNLTCTDQLTCTTLATLWSTPYIFPQIFLKPFLAPTSYFWHWQLTKWIWIPLIKIIHIANTFYLSEKKRRIGKFAFGYFVPSEICFNTFSSLNAQSISLKPVSQIDQRLGVASELRKLYEENFISLNSNMM
jgi:hypothetical protein